MNISSWMMNIGFANTPEGESNRIGSDKDRDRQRDRDRASKCACACVCIRYIAVIREMTFARMTSPLLASYTSKAQ